MKEIEWEGKGNITYIKIKTKENMFYTLSVIPWDEVAAESECQTFNSIEEYIKFMTARQIQIIVENKDKNNLIYMYPENKAIDRDNIKEIFVETHRPIVKK